MPTIAKQYSTSVNIKRDQERELDYILTDNGTRVADTILQSLDGGSRSFAIVGAYGSGKSMFLWAFARTLGKREIHFEKAAKVEAAYQIVRVVGEYRSVKEAFAEELGVVGDDTDTILDALHERYERAQKKGYGLLIEIDEFGKFLEFAVRNNPEEQLYFIQQLAEYVNDFELNLLLLVTLHQNFADYGASLSKQQRQEWSKVQGRFGEIAFNEPVEQLLLLAARRLQSLQVKPPRGFKKLFAKIEASKAFPLRDYLTEEIAESLYPLDILSAAVLTLALQRYGQNERSLFSFLNSSDHLGLNKKRSGKYYSLADVHDYLRYNFTILGTKHNPQFAQWGAIASSLERVDGLYDEQASHARALVKTIGLLNIFGTAALVLDDDFLAAYGKAALGIKEPLAVVEQLKKDKILRYTRYNKRYILFEGTDLDIELAIDEAGGLVERINNVTGALNEYFDFEVVPAKAAYFKRGTPRLFEYVLSDVLKRINVVRGEIDGVINLVFDPTISTPEIKEWAQSDTLPVLYGVYQNVDEIRKQVYDIRKVEAVKEQHAEDKVAVRELNNIIRYQRRLLNHFVLDSLTNGKGDVVWVDREGIQKLESGRKLNKRLSELVDLHYPQTPVFKSELINRTKLSGAMRKAQRNFIEHMIEQSHLEDWGFEAKRYPPEKTIFKSLVVDTGISRAEQLGGYGLFPPSKESFADLWQVSEAFISSTKQGKRSIGELEEILQKPPLRLKYGFVQFWMPLFLYAKRSDYALFDDQGAYIPHFTPEIFDLIVRHPFKYKIKAFNVTGVDFDLFQQYRKFLDQREAQPSNSSFISTVKPFLTFYRQLSAYAKKTNRVSEEAQAIREVIAKATDPEALFFRDFPIALKTTKTEITYSKRSSELYIEKLQAAFRSIREADQRLADRFYAAIKEHTGYEDVRLMLKKRYEALQTSILTKPQNVFVQRMISDLDRNAWLSSLSQALVGRRLDQLDDATEPRLHHAFTVMIGELDNLSTLTAASSTADSRHYQVLVDLQSTEQGRKRQVVQLSKKKQKAVTALKDQIRGSFGKDKKVAIAALTELLNEMIHE